MNSRESTFTQIPQFALLPPGDHVGTGAADGHDDVVVGLVARFAVAFDGAEQHEFFTGIVRRHRDAVIGDRNDQALRARDTVRHEGEHECGDDRDKALFHPPLPRSRME